MRYIFGDAAFWGRSLLCCREREFRPRRAAAASGGRRSPGETPVSDASVGARAAWRAMRLLCACENTC